MGPNSIVVASVSGGKDSTAMCLYLKECGIEHRRVFADTGWEAPETYEYINGYLQEQLGPIDVVKAPLGMVDMIRFKGMFPSRVIRFCSSELKVVPLKNYHASVAEQTGKIVIQAIGIRRGESKARSLLDEWDSMPSAGFKTEVWRPLIDWTEQDIIDIHARHDLRPNPLYLRGHSRVGCYPCIFARKAEIRMIAENAPERIEEIAALEREITEAAQARAALMGKECPPRTFFQSRGDGPALDIRQVVEWSKTARGGKQFELFADSDPNAGCVRWGLCES